MPKASPIQTSFNAGELSPLLKGRVDVDRYRAGLETCENYIPLVQGPLVRRPGTYHVEIAHDSSNAPRLIPFEFKNTQAYVLEFSGTYMRVFKDRGLVLSGGSPYLLAHGLGISVVQGMKYAQSADTMFLAHKDQHVAVLTRSDHNNWSMGLFLSYTNIDVKGPYLNVNTTSTTLTPSGTTGAITITASAVTGINDGDGFESGDLYRLIRFKDSGGNWSHMVITGVTSTTVVSATILGPDLASAAASADWRMGAFGGRMGHPSCVTLFEDRLWFSGVPGAPQTIYGSTLGDYYDFLPTELDGTVTDANAITFTLAANSMNAVNWLLDNSEGLIAGTANGEWLIRASRDGEALTPTNVTARRTTVYGSLDAQPVRVEDSVLFAQAAGRKIRGVAYAQDPENTKSGNLTLFAEHITKGGLTGEFAFQKEPHGLVWAIRNDGVLVSFTYDKEENVIAGARHLIGGPDAAVESIAVIPSPTYGYTELWLATYRYFGSSFRRFIEYMVIPWEEGTAQEDAFFVDSGLTYDGVSATTISGLDHLVDQTVSVLADGAVHPDCTVNASGEITLNRAASVVHAGFGYTSKAKTLPVEAGAADGTAQGKIKRANNLIFRVHQMLGLKVGRDENNVDEVIFRTSSDAMDTAIALYDGDIEIQLDDDYDTQGQIYWEQDQPVPGTILAIMAQLNTQDR